LKIIFDSIKTLPLETTLDLESMGNDTFLLVLNLLVPFTVNSC